MEDDVDVWRYAIVSRMPERTTNLEWPMTVAELNKLSCMFDITLDRYDVDNGLIMIHGKITALLSRTFHLTNGHV